MRKTISFTILLLSMLTIMAAAAIAPMLGILREYFSDVSDLSIRLILTLPQILIIPSSLAAGRLSKTISKRRLLIAGLILYITGGLSGGLTHSIVTLLIFRAVLGIGIGIIFPITTSLVSDFFTGDERTRMMGLSTALNNFGGVIATLLTGILAINSWRPPFLIYSLAVIVLVCVIVWIPDVKKEQTTHHESPEDSASHGYTGRIITGIFVLNIIFYTIPSTTSMIIHRLSLGGSIFCGSMLAIQNFCSFSSGVLFKRIFSVLSHAVRYVSMILMGAGFILFSIYHTRSVLVISLVLIGTGFGILTPYYFLEISNATTGHRRVVTLSWASCAMFLGQFLNPVMIDLFQKAALRYSGTIMLPTSASAILILPVLASMLVNDITQHQRHSVNHLPE